MGPGGATDLGELHAAVSAALAAELPGAARLRRRLHAHPEISGAEAATAAQVSGALGCPGAPAVAGTGRLVRIGPADGPAIAVRAELDALPVAEDTGAPYAAAGGLMHACGHDLHLAALAALARAMRRVGLPVAMLAILQPREETHPSGALDIVRSGELRRHQVRAVVGAHVQPRLPAGTAAADAGVVNAGADELTITIEGSGGHAGYPHLARDPVPALCRCVTSLPGTLRSAVDPMRPATVSVGVLCAGEAANVIPGTARARGTLRTFGAGDRARAIEAIGRLVTGIAAAHHCTGTVRADQIEPPLSNDPRLARYARGWLARSGSSVSEGFRSCGSDDFSHYGTRLPSLMMFVGTGEGSGSPMLHEPRFLPPDDVIADVAHAMLAGYLAALQHHLGNDGGPAVVTPVLP
jgi:amidohydrolase